MCSIIFANDPLDSENNGNPIRLTQKIVTAQCPMDTIIPKSFKNERMAFHEGGRSAQISLADYVSRMLTKRCTYDTSKQKQYYIKSANNEYKYLIQIEMLDQMTSKLQSRSSTKKKKQSVVWKHKKTQLPYVFERTDLWCNPNYLSMTLRVFWRASDDNLIKSVDESKMMEETKAVLLQIINDWVIDPIQNRPLSLFSYIASHVLQDRIRHQLHHLSPASDDSFTNENENENDTNAFKSNIQHGKDKKIHAVSFLTNGSILPRKSGTSTRPMASPPAVPLIAPTTYMQVGNKPVDPIKDKSPMHKTLTLSMGMYIGWFLKIPEHYKCGIIIRKVCNDNDVDKNVSRLEKQDSFGHECKVELNGLMIPRGVTLIVGGGYHGKSTLLRAIALGIHNKIPGDGREYCVTTRSAVSIRAEDGRYVQNCNISAFISNLPFAPRNKLTNATDNSTTKRFSTKEASGSTSQATNVSEAIEMGATTLLVDEDISAANFMARDGRMRSLVSNESITPLLYRVNGLYNTSNIYRQNEAGGVSTVVVVGGVGDWLDVPHTVILMEKYQVYDATKKAKSVSETFSYGHVQYGGRGVVHRLEWDDEGTPLQRRPLINFGNGNENNNNNDWGKGLSMSIQAGGSILYMDSIMDNANTAEDESLQNGHNTTVCQIPENNDTDHLDNEYDDEYEDDDDKGVIDMSRCEQLFGSTHELYGCGMCLVWLLKYASQHPKMGMQDLLEKMDEILDDTSEFGGLKKLQEITLVADKNCTENDTLGISMLESVGYAIRPRRYEVAMALTRMRGMMFETLPPVRDFGSEAAAAKIEAEQKKQKLLALWNARRKPKRFKDQFI